MEFAVAATCHAASRASRSPVGSLSEGLRRLRALREQLVRGCAREARERAIGVAKARRALDQSSWSKISPSNGIRCRGWPQDE